MPRTRPSFPGGKHRASSSDPEHVDGKETIHRGGWSCVSVGGRCVRRRLGSTVIRVVVVRRRLSAKKREKEKEGEREASIGSAKEDEEGKRSQNRDRAKRSGGARRVKVCSGGKRTCTWASTRGGSETVGYFLNGRLDTHIF